MNPVSTFALKSNATALIEPLLVRINVGNVTVRVRQLDESDIAITQTARYYCAIRRSSRYVANR